MSPIITAPNPILREVAKPIDSLSPKIISLISDMTSTLLAAKNPEGVGLAAPQIGASLRIFLIRPRLESKPQVFINPEITSFSKRLQSPSSKNGIYEGCLSIPHHYAPLSRSLSITVKYLKPDAGNAKLIPVRQSFSGLAAHVIQHEMDHLNGILFIDRVLEQNVKLFKTEGKTWLEVTL